MLRSGLSWVAMMGLLVPSAGFAAGTSYQASRPTYVSSAAAVSAPASLPVHSVVSMPPPHGGGQGPGDRDGDGHGPRHFHHRFGLPFVYASMYTPPSGAGDDSDDDASDKVRTQYVPVPYPVPVMPPAPPKPRPPPPIVRYAITGEPIDIPKGAHVTTGSVYRYQRNGVSVYTDAPPPAGAHGTLLFGYTEAVAPASSPDR